MATWMAILSRCESRASPIFPAKQLEAIKDMSNWALTDSPEPLQLAGSPPNLCSAVAWFFITITLWCSPTPAPWKLTIHPVTFNGVMPLQDICAGFKEAKAVAAVHFLLEHPWKLASQARGWFSNHLLADISSATQKSTQLKLGPRGEFTCLVFRSVSIISSNYRIQQQDISEVNWPSLGWGPKLKNHPIFI